MGFWSAIKYAVNSSLGTDEFQPIDQIVKGQRGLVASDNLFAVVYSGSTKYVNSGESLDIFVSKWQGTFNISVNRDFYLLKNGVNVWNTSQGRTPISCKNGDLFAIRPMYNARTPFDEINIYADMRDLSAFDILLEV